MIIIIISILFRCRSNYLWERDDPRVFATIPFHFNFNQQGCLWWWTRYKVIVIIVVIIVIIITIIIIMIIKKIITRVRAVMLDTALQPYTDIADLFIVDPDGYIIRLPIIIIFRSVYLILCQKYSCWKLYKGLLVRYSFILAHYTTFVSRAAILKSNLQIGRFLILQISERIRLQNFVNYQKLSWKISNCTSTLIKMWDLLLITSSLPIYQLNHQSLSIKVFHYWH